MPTLLSFHKLGAAHNAPRVWLENGRLARFGFPRGTRYDCEPSGPSRVVLVPRAQGNRVVSHRAGVPVVDINSNRLLGGLREFDAVKIRASWQRIEILPSVQGFHIRRGLRQLDTLRVLHFCAGGGAFAAAWRSVADVRTVAAVEKDRRFAHWYDAANPDCETLVVADMRHVTPAELPGSDVVCMGLPCGDTSNLGRTSKGLAGAPERGEFVDLLVPGLAYVAARMPAAVVAENVPSYATDATGWILRTHLRNLGYEIAVDEIIDPAGQWGDVQDRRRWCLIATLRPGFRLVAPGARNTQSVREFLDVPDAERDRADAARWATTVAGLTSRESAHKAAGNGFRFTVLDPEATTIPTITKSCGRGNLQGPWIETPFGKRLARPAELARLSGHPLPAGVPTRPASEIIGQGAAVRTWAQIFGQLAAFLRTPAFFTLSPDHP
jgi:DNA (cytosine-5)-methyltransferase 1